jgi:adenosine deaminase
MKTIRDQVKKLPKADVHNHLHLGGSMEMLVQKYPGANLNIPKYFNGLNGMIDFINDHVNTVMLTSDDMIYFMEMAIKNSISDNVTHLEASVDIGFIRFFNNSLEELLAVVQQLKDNYKSHIDFRPDIGINKDYPLDKINLHGLKCIESGLFGGIDIYGKEKNKKLNEFVGIFDAAKKNGLKTKVHIGEFSDYKTIENAISLLHPTEIQHGISAVDSEETMNMILNDDIQLNICPQSNICLGAVQRISEHPIRKMYDHGIKITINTDDLLLFNGTITDQCVDLLEHGIFTLAEIDSILKNAFN